MRMITDMFRYQKVAFFGLLLVAGMFVVGAIAPWIAPYDYRVQNLDAAQMPPSWEHPLGTDDVGRDQLSRLIYGARTASFVVVVTLALSMPLGLAVGSISGYFGGWVDTLVMRLADIMFAFPSILLILFLSATIQPRIDALARSAEIFAPIVRAGYVDYITVTIIMAVVGWAGQARLVRSLFLKLKGEEFVTAAKAMGATEWRIIFRHILPNALGPIIVSLSLAAGGIILSEAFLSLFGMGIRPPNPSWGAMIYTAYAWWRTRPWMILGPGALVALMVFAFNALGDGLNAVLNPQVIKER